MRLFVISSIKAPRLRQPSTQLGRGLRGEGGSPLYSAIINKRAPICNFEKASATRTENRSVSARSVGRGETIQTSGWSSELVFNRDGFKFLPFGSSSQNDRIDFAGLQRSVW